VAGYAPAAGNYRILGEVESRRGVALVIRGRLAFDTELLRQPIAFRREVIIHELLHLKVPNHGKLFKALLRAHRAEAGQRVCRSSQ
jgi:predicted metal-dependent hydrolase